MKKYFLFNRLHEGVQVIDSTMCYFYVNEAVAKQCKLRTDELLGRRMTELFPSLIGSEVLQRIERCMKTKQPDEMLNKFEHNDGSNGWFELRMETVDDGVIIFSIDVTKQRELEEQVRKSEEEFNADLEVRTEELMEELKNEMALNNYKAKFVSMAAHQCRTPLTSIILSADIIENFGLDLLKKEDVARQIGRIKSSATHMVAVLNDFLSFDKLASNKSRYVPVFINLRAFIDELNEMITPLLKSAQRIVTEVNHPSKNVCIDPYVMKAVMLNLLSNAIKYSTENSTIHLVIDAHGDNFRFSVQDQGIGIPVEEQEKLFGTFFRASNASHIQGNGLGLKIVDEYVRLAGGSIQFDSTEGKGTEFVVEIPELVGECMQ